MSAFDSSIHSNMFLYILNAGELQSSFFEVSEAFAPFRSSASPMLFYMQLIILSGMQHSEAYKIFRIVDGISLPESELYLLLLSPYSSGRIQSSHKNQKYKTFPYLPRQEDLDRVLSPCLSSARTLPYS